ncbi:carbohydrate ABC transporter permease [Actinomyces bowdenii]|uniref:Carbohydrate ABC transporter permease n=1 Tax=Actinomyces bowdenii TaxID=131109 RepID=A0A853EFU9_9ACTO|nr:carbohydrate ABC transporter permease [Actinomyces bowdenii]MBF0696045.1 carbohydrate ABC transporter permease [Actinomyces bowdenii]MCR2051714.1 carbohydrate ABC transporter permease [Actinomyces bowdenii]MDO5063525.1 carbohydrate ABC transporter permease [Actinomyces bowdenii]NYS68218.1 carbohydrate ABC transporter permease [Actinomyces bowdenii]
MSTPVAAAPASSKADKPAEYRFKRHIWGQVFSTLGIGLIVIYCLAPFYWMLVSSLRPDAEIFDNSWWPANPSLENYEAVFSAKNNFVSGLVNSLIVSVAVTIIALAVATFTSYALARLDFRGKGMLLMLIIATSMFPLVAIIVPLLKNFSNWGWVDTYQAMIIPDLSFSLPLAVWNLTTFFRQMPQELEQAAMVDGCTPGQAFRKVILPLAAPGIFTTAIIIFIGAWNEFLVAVTMIKNPAMQPATVLLAKFTGATQFNTPFGSQMAAGVVMTLPLVLMVLFFQRRIVAGLAAGGVK